TGHQRHEPGAVLDVHLPCQHEIAREGVIGWWAHHEPEPGGLGLLAGTPGARLAAIVTEFVEILRPGFAVQRYRRRRSKLRSFGDRKRLHARPHRTRRDRRRDVDAGRLSPPPVIP